ncbi:MAG: exodeoxyribonuclease VII large subunit, partial [bacterium]
MSQPTYTVKRLVGDIRALLAENYGEIWVEGEISSLATPASGHRYFTLAEGDAVIRCVLFKHNRLRLATAPTEGMKALLRARVSLYEARGDLQLIVSYLEDAGEGALRRAFEELKRRLADEGLFDAKRKKLLPKHPRSVGVITSERGAA